MALPVSAAPAVRKTLDEIAVVVDQDAMTRGELEESLQAYFYSLYGPKAKMPPPSSLDYQAAKKQVVDSFIQEVLLAEEADRQKIEISDGEIDHEVNNEVETMKKGFATEQDFDDGLRKENITLDDLRQEIHDKFLRRLKANRVLRMKQQELPGATNVSDGEIRAYFDKHPKDYEQVKFSIILFRIAPKARPALAKEVESQAQNVLRELQGGADFAVYAKKYSEDAGSADKGGAVGTMYRSQLEPQLAKGIFAIPAKGMGIVKVPEGVYIVKVDYKGKADYASVAPEIKDHLLKERQSSGLKDWVDSLKKKATISIDGKVQTFVESPEPVTAEGEEASAAPSKGEATPGAASTTGPSTVTYTDQKGEEYPSLPQGGSLAVAFGGEGFSYGTQDLASIYGSVSGTNQGFPFGFGVNGEIDFAVDPTLEIGVLVEALQKISETIFDTVGTKYEWNASTLAPSLSAKFLIPLDESTNFFLQAAGGYHFLTGANEKISGSAVTETIEMSGANFGGKAGVGIEFMLDDHHNSAIDLGADYRYLKFTPLTTKVDANTGGGVPPSPLPNLDGSPAMLDFSGIDVFINVRFYLGKD